MDNQLASKEALLKDILRGYKSVAVALSGGVDSTLLMDVAFETLGPEALALTANMAGLPKRELAAAQTFCKKRGMQHLTVEFDEFSVPGFAENPFDRCYHCKHALLTQLIKAAAAEGITVLAEGSNLDDDKDYRPGMAAIAELGVESPLKRAGFTKDDVRMLSKKRALPTWNKPACACLATRLPFNTPLSPGLLDRIDAAEQCVLDQGAQQVRVRVHEELARIEVGEDDLHLFFDDKVRNEVMTCLRTLGFTYVTLDLQGYRSGSMHENFLRPA